MTPEEHIEIMAKLTAIREDVAKVDRILSGEPEYKREGLVQIVDRHEAYIKKGGGIIVGLYIIWEWFKYYHPPMI